MTADNGDIDSLYRSQFRHPLTGVRGSHPGPENRYTSSSPDALNWTSIYGKWCEKVLQLHWTDKGCDIPKSKLIIESSHKVRERLEPAITNRVHRHNHEVELFYQALTLPSELPFSGHERQTPSWKPLEVLFRMNDSRYGTDFIKKFRDIGQSPTQPGVVHPGIRYLTENALIIARLHEESPPFKNDHVFIPNVWTPGQSAQFDGVLIPRDKNAPTERLGFNLEDYWKSGSPWHIAEVKVENRVRHTTGQHNRLDKGPLNRHILELQKKLARCIYANPESFQFPQSAVFVYLRGTLPHVIHKIQFDYQFLNDWRTGLEISMTNGYVTDDKVQVAEILLRHLDQEIEVITEQERQRRYRQQVSSQIKLPEDGTKQHDLFNVTQYQKNELEAAIPQPLIRKAKKEKVTNYKFNFIAPPPQQEEENTQNIFELEWGGRSLYTLANTLDTVSEMLLNEGDEAYQNAFFSGGRGVGYSFLVNNIYKNPSYNSTLPAKFSFSRVKEDIIPGDNDNKRKISVVDAPQFILQIGKNMQNFLLQERDLKTVFSFCGNELNVYSEMARLLKGRKFALVHDYTRENGTYCISKISWYKDDTDLSLNRDRVIVAD